MAKKTARHGGSPAPYTKYKKRECAYSDLRKKYPADYHRKLKES